MTTITISHRMSALFRRDRGPIRMRPTAVTVQHGRVHELSLCHAIAGVVKPHAAGRRVDVVRVRVGALRQVVPESLEFCWSLVRDHESMPDAELELEFVPAEVMCASCNQRSTIESRYSVRCPQCGGVDVQVVQGEEFLVTSLDVT